jgi:hypothetical protein
VATKRLLFGIALYNSLIFGAQNGALVNVPNNQHGGVSVCANNSTRTIPYPLGKISPSTLKQPQKISFQKTGKDFVHQRKILEVAAAKELMARELTAKPMSEYITRKYIGEGDEQSSFRSLVAQIGFCDWWHSVDSATQTLTEIYHYFEPATWTQPRIFDLFCTNSSPYNSRLANLLNGLITIKRKKYYIVPTYITPCSINLKGSTIDDFFDERFMFPDLPTPFQQFIQRQIEGEFPHTCMFDKPELVKEHSTTFLILFTALHNSGDNVAEIKSFFTSTAFQKHEEKTHFALTEHIKKNKNKDDFWCSWFDIECEK